MHLVSENRACTGGTESNFLNEASIKALATLIASADNLCCNPGLQIRIQLFTLMCIRILILLLIKAMRICNHWSTGPPGLYF